MGTVREPAVAGSFYPADPDRLRRDVTTLLTVVPDGGPAHPKALIVPHAGYVYSGPVAASGYAALRSIAGGVRRVILCGPAHYTWVEGLALPGADALATPLGEVEIDQAGEQMAREHPAVTVSPDAHRREHSLEVQLPLLQVVLQEFSVVALLTGSEGHLDVAEVIGRFLGDPGTVVVISSDLSHYLSAASARERDEQTAAAIDNLRPEAIGREDACGRVAVQGMLAAAREAGLAAHRLDLRNSADTAGPPDRTVGYGSWAFA